MFNLSIHFPKRYVTQDILTDYQLMPYKEFINATVSLSVTVDIIDEFIGLLYSLKPIYEGKVTSEQQYNWL